MPIRAVNMSGGMADLAGGMEHDPTRFGSSGPVLIQSVLSVTKSQNGPVVVNWNQATINGNHLVLLYMNTNAESPDLSGAGYTRDHILNAGSGEPIGVIYHASSASSRSSESVGSLFASRAIGLFEFSGVVTSSPEDVFHSAIGVPASTVQTGTSATLAQAVEAAVVMLSGRTITDSDLTLSGGFTHLAFGKNDGSSGDPLESVIGYQITSSTTALACQATLGASVNNRGMLVTYKGA